jgi:hypothetical protein
MNLVRRMGCPFKFLNLTCQKAFWGVGAPNGWRFPLVGQDNAILPERTPSHANCLQTCRVPPC